MEFKTLRSPDPALTSLTNTVHLEFEHIDVATSQSLVPNCVDYNFTVTTFGFSFRDANPHKIRQQNLLRESFFQTLAFCDTAHVQCMHEYCHFTVHLNFSIYTETIIYL
jgi:hypothetical protein